MQELCQILSLAHIAQHRSPISADLAFERATGPYGPLIKSMRPKPKTSPREPKPDGIYAAGACVTPIHSLKIEGTYSVNSMHPRFSHIYLSINFIICSHSMSKHAVKTMTWDHCRIQVAFQMLQLVGALRGDLEMLSTGEYWYTHMSRNSALCCLSEHDPKTVDLRCHKCSKLIKVRELHMSQFTT